MWAIVLVGGFGSRLQSVLPNVPKPMAPIAGKPFLSYLLCYLRDQGITDVVLSVHYLREQIHEYFSSSFEGLRIHYAIEETPLGTGGAILNAFSLVNSENPCFVINGDTFIKFNYRDCFNQHINTQAAFTMVLCQVKDCSRYGRVICHDEKIVAFKEKGEKGPGLINAGVYLFKRCLFAHFALTTQFSFEKDFLFPYVLQLEPHAFLVNDYFIDIGIPDDYARAQLELPYGWLNGSVT